MEIESNPNGTKSITLSNGDVLEKLVVDKNTNVFIFDNAFVKHLVIEDSNVFLTCNKKHFKTLAIGQDIFVKESELEKDTGIIYKGNKMYFIAPENNEHLTYCGEPL